MGAPVGSGVGILPVGLSVAPGEEGAALSIAVASVGEIVGALGSRQHCKAEV